MRSLFLTIAIATALPLFADFQAGLEAYKKGDYVAAAKEWRPLADQGDVQAQFNLGLLYVDGHGVPKSYAEAVNWFRRAAEQGYAPAQHNLGAMYATGHGVKRDYIQAYKWFNICAAQDNAGCATQRDLIAKKLKHGQIDEAQRLAVQFTPELENKTAVPTPQSPATSNKPPVTTNQPPTTDNQPSVSNQSPATKH